MKRGQTDYSFILGVRKPRGLSSHDVVNACRRAFGEKRVGHAGTLDPMAEGVLLMLVGPAARLNAYLEGHDKRYVARISFGAATDTDDAEGTVIRQAPVSVDVLNAHYAQNILDSFLGDHMQMPPAYSAIKQAGQKSYEAARKGTILDLQARPITVHTAELLEVGELEGAPYWDVAFEVSKGTYIRALARDIGRTAGTEAHLSALTRENIGVVTLSECISLESLEQSGHAAVAQALDPVRVVGYRFAFLDGEVASALSNGAALSSDHVCLHEGLEGRPFNGCSCTSNMRASVEPAHDGERVLMLADNCVKAVYTYNAAKSAFVPACVFSKGISRGCV